MSHLLFSVLYGPYDPNDVTRIIKTYHKCFVHYYTSRYTLKNTVLCYLTGLSQVISQEIVKKSEKLYYRSMKA